MYPAPTPTPSKTPADKAFRDHFDAGRRSSMSNKFLAVIRQREWRAARPPTEKQIAYGTTLGWTGEVPDRQAALDLIDRLRTRRATP